MSYTPLHTWFTHKCVLHYTPLYTSTHTSVSYTPLYTSSPTYTLHVVHSPIYMIHTQMCPQMCLVPSPIHIIPYIRAHTGVSYTPPIHIHTLMSRALPISKLTYIRAHLYTSTHTSVLYTPLSATTFRDTPMYIHESYPVYEWSCVRYGYLTHMNGSSSRYERDMCHMWVSRVPHMGEWCPTHGWVVSHIWVSSVARMCESCPPYSWVISHDMSSFRLIVCRVWERYTSVHNTTHRERETQVYTTPLIERDTSVHNNTHTQDTGWRRPVGCLELQDIFRKRATNYRALLRKMTYKDEASYDSTPPCMTHLLVRVCGTWLFHGESCLVYRLWGGYD